MTRYYQKNNFCLFIANLAWTELKLNMILFISVSATSSGKFLGTDQAFIFPLCLLKFFSKVHTLLLISQYIQIAMRHNWDNHGDSHMTCNLCGACCLNHRPWDLESENEKCDDLVSAKFMGKLIVSIVVVKDALKACFW